MIATLRAALLMAVAVASIGAGTHLWAGAEERREIDIWATLGSVAPAVGCVVQLSVEVHDASGPRPGVDVVVGLVIDEAVVTVERSATGADGIAFLPVDTSRGGVGDKVRVEVNVAGVYVGQVPASLTADGPCSGDPTMLATSAEATIGAAGVVAATDGSGVRLNVPTYAQQHNLSCEYAALTIATGAFGPAISEHAFDERVGWSANPHWGFRGNIDGQWGNTVDYGVYPEPLVAPLAEFGFLGDVHYGAEAATLIDHLEQGKPVVVWIGLWGETGSYETMEDGTAYKLVSGYHVVVVYGYDDWGVYISDPGSGGLIAWSWSDFLSMWEVMDGMSLAVTTL